MFSSNPLLLIWDSYQNTLEALTVAKRAIKHLDSQTLLDDTRFVSQTSKEAKNAFDRSLDECSELFVLSLWASFERFLRDYLQTKCTTLQDTLPPILGEAIYAYFEKEVEFWNPENILAEIVKNVLGSHKVLASQAKHILHYRNWIAHGKNPKVKNKPSRISPKFAYKTLKDIIDLLILNQ